MLIKLNERLLFKVRLSVNRRWKSVVQPVDDGNFAWGPSYLYIGQKVWLSPYTLESFTKFPELIKSIRC